MQKIIDRFVKYITIDTQSDPNNSDFPSTEKQWDLARILVEELTKIGMKDVTIDDNCYIMATLPSNVDFKVPTIGFIAQDVQTLFPELVYNIRRGNDEEIYLYNGDIINLICKCDNNNRFNYS